MVSENLKKGLSYLAVLLVVLFVGYYVYKLLVEPMDLVSLEEGDKYIKPSALTDTVKESIETLAQGEPASKIPAPLRDIESEYPLVYQTSKVDSGPIMDLNDYAIGEPSDPPSLNKLMSLD